jgi:hypothetical protein
MPQKKSKIKIKKSKILLYTFKHTLQLFTKAQIEEIHIFLLLRMPQKKSKIKIKKSKILLYTFKHTL